LGVDLVLSFFFEWVALIPNGRWAFSAPVHRHLQGELPLPVVPPFSFAWHFIPFPWFASRPPFSQDVGYPFCFRLTPPLLSFMFSCFFLALLHPFGFRVPPAFEIASRWPPPPWFFPTLFYLPCLDSPSPPVSPPLIVFFGPPLGLSLLFPDHP